VETQRNTTEELDIRTSLLSDANKSFDALVKEKNQDVQLINSQRVELEVLRTLNSRLEKNASVLLDVISPEDSTRTIAERLNDCLPAMEKFFKSAVKDAIMDAGAVIKSHFSNVDLRVASGGHMPSTSAQQWKEYLDEAQPLGDYAADQFDFVPEN